MSVWRRAPLSVNPYLRTAFRVARVPRDVVRHRTVVQIIGQTSQVVTASQSVHVVHGRPVTTEEINWAQQILFDPRARLEEELIEHPAERPPIQALGKLDQRAADLLAPRSADTFPRPLTLLRRSGGGLCQRFLSAAPTLDPSFGALELELPAPFGDAGNL